MPYVNGEYVMPGGDDDMFAPWPVDEVDCSDPTCDECVNPRKRRRRRVTVATAPAGVAAFATVSAGADGPSAAAELLSSVATAGPSAETPPSAHFELALVAYNKENASTEHWRLEEAADFCGGADRQSARCMSCDLDFEKAFQQGSAQRYLINVRTPLGITQKLCEGCMQTRIYRLGRGTIQHGARAAADGEL